MKYISRYLEPKDEDVRDIVIIQLSERERNCIAELLFIGNFLSASIYCAQKVIIPKGLIVDKVSVHFKVGDYIILNNNFEVEKGADFEAIIDKANSYCSVSTNSHLKTLF